MAGKQIGELDSLSVFSTSDLLLARNTSSGTDKKITGSDFIKSIGNPGIEGFTAVAHATEANTIILTPVNGAKIPSYLTGMKISFVSPIKNTSLVKIKIDNLSSVDFLQYQTTQSVSLAVDDYVEGVFINSKFYQINNFRAVNNIYSNEYSVVATSIEADKSSTTLVLSSAIGIRKTSYYDGMSINFICSEDTEGRTRVTIDDISGSEKDILEPGTPLGDTPKSLPLYANQIVRAIYKSAEGGFIKDRFSIKDPAVKIPIDVKPQEQPADQDEPKKEPVTDVAPQNLDTFTVASTGEATYKNLKEALADLIEKHGDSGTGKKITLQIKYVLLDTENIIAIENDYSWITLEGKYTFNDGNTEYKDVIAIQGNSLPSLFCLKGNKAKFFSFKENSTIVTLAPLTMFFLSEGATLTLTKVTIKDISPSALAVRTRYMIYAQSLNPCLVTLNECILDGGDVPIFLSGSSPCTITGTYIKNYKKFGITITGGSLWGHNKLQLTSSSILAIDKTTADSSNLNFSTEMCHNVVTQTNSQAKSNFVNYSNNKDTRNNEYVVIGDPDIKA